MVDLPGLCGSQSIAPNTSPTNSDKSADFLDDVLASVPPIRLAATPTSTFLSGTDDIANPGRSPGYSTDSDSSVGIEGDDLEMVSRAAGLGIRVETERGVGMNVVGGAR